MIVPFVLALAGGWLGFANPLFHLPILVLLFPAGLTVLALNAPSAWSAWRRSLATGSAVYAAGLYWLVIPVHVYGGLSWFLALPCPVLVGLYLGLFPACFVLAIRYGTRRLPAGLAGLFAGLVWAVLEYARGHLFTGLPWLVLAQAFSPWPLLIQGASVLGAYGLSGAFVSLAVWGVLALRRPRLAAWPVTLLAVILAHGAWELRVAPVAVGTLSVGLVQGNIAQDLKWDESFQAGTVETYLDLTRQQIATGRTALVVWPETALPFYFQEPGELAHRVEAFVRDNGLHLITGSPAYSIQPDGNYTLYNRAFLVGPQGGVRGYYDKEHLVPFGEYIPFSRLLPFMRKLVSGAGDFAPGLQTAPLQADEAVMGLLICYEAIFPELSQKRVREGANVLVNISNDAWFGASSAPLQHLHLALLRAVEQRRWMVRSTNTGITTFVDPKGRLVRQGGLFVPAMLREQQVELIAERSFFSLHYGPIHALGLLLPGLFIVFAAWWSLKGRDLDDTVPSHAVAKGKAGSRPASDPALAGDAPNTDRRDNHG